MTTYSIAFILEGEEIAIYRRMLEMWASTASDGQLATVQRLIKNTYDSTGEIAAKVEEHLRSEALWPFQIVMDAEEMRVTALLEANRMLPFEERDFGISTEMMLLESVLEKLRNEHMSSTYIRARKHPE